MSQYSPYKCTDNMQSILDYSLSVVIKIKIHNIEAGQSNTVLVGKVKKDNSTQIHLQG